MRNKYANRQRKKDFVDLEYNDPERTLREYGHKSTSSCANSLVGYRVEFMSPFEELENQEKTRILENALNQLPPMYSAVLRARFYEGGTLAEIGPELNITSETVRKRQIIGLKKLNDFFVHEKHLGKW